MNIKIIAPLRNFLFKKADTRLKMNGFIATNRQREIQEFILLSPPFSLAVGGINFRTLSDNVCIYYSGNLRSLNVIYDDRNLVAVGRSLLVLFQSYLFAMWLIKDNSVNIFEGFLSSLDETNVREYRHDVNSNSAGSYEDVYFDDDEFNRICRIQEVLLPIFLVNDNSDPTPNFGTNPSVYNKILYNNHNRIRRALDFLCRARYESFLPSKISMYMAVLESLFNTSKSDVDKTVRKRTALFLGGNENIQTLNSEIIKKAYNVRSNYIHGQILGKAENSRNLIDLSQKVDNLIRQVLTKAIDEPSFQMKEKDAIKWIDNTFKLSLRNTFTFKDFTEVNTAGSNFKIYTHEPPCNKSFISEHPLKLCPFCKGAAEIIT
ncbi:HEPN domain-containing protein [Sporocytophaga myxococcoides]|uniref:HEPN domain-containing protein n=1 Tax=Sporocytophaga myxococcoides TaxID=153721 RepID=UPI000403413D|nr:HEPN domain-containing protein [Sporocytophaga myxococcoides]